MVSWHVIWRETWYSVVISRLTVISLVIFIAFVAAVFDWRRFRFT
jgi:hypothetical protein